MYQDPSTRHLGIKSFYSRVAQKYEGVSRTDVENFLKTKQEYQRYLPEKLNFSQHYITKKLLAIIQIDFIDLQLISRLNNGFKYILTAINHFFKMVWAFPVRSRDMKYQVQSLKWLVTYYKLKG